MAAAVDLGFLSNHLSLPQETLDTVASDPTPELVAVVLTAVAAKAREYDELYSEKLNVDIALENAVRSSESRCQTFKTTADNALKELETVRRKLQDEETARQNLENQLQALRSESTTSTSQAETLRARIASLEASKRDTMAILDTKNAANLELANELQKQHQKAVALSQELNTAQQEVQAAKAASNTAKFREQSVRQELDLSQKQNEWLDKELKTKSAEALKYRKEKGQRISELQRLNDEANATVDALTKSEQQLRSRLDAAQRKTEEALTKLQQLQESSARSEAGYRQEVETAKRLATVSQEYADQYKKEMTQLREMLDQAKDHHADELRKVLQQLEQARQDCNELEQKMHELQSQVDQLQTSHGRDTMPGSAPQTPMPNGSQFRPGSPFGTPGSIRVKSHISASQAVEELFKVKGELAGEKRRNRELTKEIDDMISTLEAKEPEIRELQDENDMLKNENMRMSSQMDQSFNERDAAKRAARRAEGASASAQAEVKLLRAQMRDLSTQIQVLIFNMHAREKGLDQLTDEEVEHFSRLQRGEVSENSLNDMSDTHMLITEKFVAFKDIAELQEKNEELLRVTRDLAYKFENEEALAAQRNAAQDQQEIEKLRDLVTKLQEESQALTTRMKSYMTERDMFRRMLQQKATAGEIQSVLGNSVDGREVLASIEQNNTDDQDLNAALRELQNNFDAYRNEQSIDLQTVREQAKQLADDKSALQAEVARVTSQLSLLTERYETLQGTNADLEAQKEHLKKRASDLSQQVAKTEGLAQSRAEDLIETKGLLESMRAENSNLKAEKSLWKSIQDRLIKDNEDLGEEKSRLSNLLASQQSLQNERQLSESETKRRMQSQIDTLETELNTTKRRLADEVEESKKLQLRKEYDTQQAQKRIDDLMAALSQNKEESIALKTSRDHLQARVDELTIEVRSAEERAQRLQPQLTSRANHTNAGEDNEDQETRIQELTGEVVDLRRELEIANTRLENAKAEAEHFKELAQTMEEDLRSLESSQETYREELDSTIAAKDAKIKELEQRVGDLSAELATSNSELSSLRDSQGEISRRFEDEKRILDSEITRLRDQESRYKETAKHHQANLRAQAEIATKAQQDYEQELLKHAEAAKQLQQLRTEHNKLKSTAATWRSEAESAKLTLSQSESSWEERRKQLEQELSELKTRRDDANAQNKLLHDQLANVTTQISDLQQSRSFGDDSSATAPVFADTAVEGLRELNSYLRKEKEILEYQYELKLQDSKRLQQQVNYLQAQLDEARLKLEQERRTQAESGTNSKAYTELMDKVNEMNVIRESNVTLRNEIKQLQRQVEQKSTRVQQLETQLHPLQARVGELENQEVYLQEEIKQLQEDRDRWQKRTESILTKYGRVDPGELEQMKQSVADLEAERDALKQNEDGIKAQLEEAQKTLESERTKWNEARGRIIDQAKTKAREQTGVIRNLNEELNTLKESVKSLEASLEVVRSEKAALEEQLATAQEQVQQQQQQMQEPASEANAATSAPDAMVVDEGRTAQIEQELAALRQELEATVSLKAEAESQVESLRLQLAAAVEERDQAVALAQAKQQQQQQIPSGTESGEPNTTQAGVTGLSDEERLSLQSKIAEAEARAADAEKKAAEIEANMAATLNQRSDKMKEALNKKLRESKENNAKELSEKTAALQQQYDLRLEQERKIWLAEHSSAAAVTTDQGAVPATPSKQENDQASSTPIDPSKVDFSKLSDEATRKLLSENATIKSILSNNIKKKAELEAKKAVEEAEQRMKGDLDTKIAQAREQATTLAEKKSTLRINMQENKLRMANGKLAVVEKAVKETPQKPVVEVWEEVKQYKPPTVTTAQPQAVGTPAKGGQTPVASAASAIGRPAGQQVPSTPATPGAQTSVQTGAPAGSSLPAKPQPAVQPPSLQKPAVLNPFAQSTGLANAAPSNNPFAQVPSQIPQPGQTQQVGQPQSGLPQPRTGLPQPGRGRGRGGASGIARGASNIGRGGRGGGAARSASGPVGGGMNPAANDFQPGSGIKRPRPESEVGAGAPGGGKRMRGGAGGGAAGGGNNATE
ncbi:hypothetical protein PpBr36_08573 [Pyricularia pennisetigena]|uniref:hypothetical protein n=1 Tax=Pyricularia pennisetigena TaxID=1578925 RepID=UPI00114DE536|nr:hypothetical protein PpBr36_08573 [Pyricularia pennisetigena]TLS23849.1 hypothetical protein PpBr36_08573 [Pyricularia pennisetigena]